MDNQKQTIIFDVDGVLINWQSQLPFFCTRKGLDTSHVLKQYTSPAHLTPMDLFGVHSEKIASNLLDMYNLEHGKYMTAFTDAVEHIHKLSKKYNLVALTKFGNSVEHYTVRKYNLETFFPRCFSELISIGYDEDKSSYINNIRINHGNIIAFIDDQLSYIDDVRKHHSDIQSIHLNRYDSLAELSDISEIEDYLRK